MFVPRRLGDHLRRLARSFPVLLLTGPRQVGKTTLLRHLGDAETPARRYVSLDEAVPRQLALEEPELVLQRYPAPVIIDEVQHAPGLLAALKPLADRSTRSGRHGGWWLTGSQHFPLMREVSESLAGRVGVVAMLGLSQAEESLRRLDTAPFRPDRLEANRESPSGETPTELLDVFERIVRGSFPRLVHPDAPPIESFYGSYVQTYIERDVRALLSITDLAAFQRFLRVAAARTGQLLNYSDLARDVGIAVSTAREWLHLLEATYQVLLLRPYYANIGKRQVKTPKLYFLDTGLVCYLTGWRSAETASSGAMAGALLETQVVAEIVKSYWHSGREAPVWFFRTRDGKEVDLLIAEDGQLFPVEVKLTARPSTTRDLRGIRALERTGAPVGHGALVCLIRDGVPLSATVDAVPAGQFA